MKKVLFATTALVASASMAYADGHATGGISLSGSGRFGIVYDGSQDAAGQSKTKIEKRMTINIDGSGSTDGGLEFGGRIRLRSDEGEAASAQSSANVWMGNDMFRITVGNTNGSMLQRVGYYQGSIGLTGLHWANVSFNIGTNRFNLDSYSSRGGGMADVVRLDFNVGGFGVSLSTNSTGDHLSNGSEDSIAASYNFGDWTVAAGFVSEFDGVNDAFSLSANGSIGDFSIGLGYTDKETIGSKVTLAGGYDFGDTRVEAFVANSSEDTVGSAGIGAAGEETEYGIGFTHSLGGAVLAGGVSRNFTEDTMADLGIRFNF